VYDEKTKGSKLPLDMIPNPGRFPGIKLEFSYTKASMKPSEEEYSNRQNPFRSLLKNEPVFS